ncbi:CubicO group peptidase (beta-lactamase class C family) [Oxalobacteraceae bacterium GrIS 2.11]
MTSTWKLALTCVALIFLAVVLWMKISPPELIRVGSNYSAKIVCTNVFMVGRDPSEVLQLDVQAPGHPLLKLVQIYIDQKNKLVRANLLGMFGRGLAVYRPGTGCATLPDAEVEQARTNQFTPGKILMPTPDQNWPAGSKAQLDERIENIIKDEELAGPGMRGIAVIHNGKLVAQHYGKGFNERTPLLGWSMTKTVTAVLVGMQIKSGKLKLDQAGFWPATTPSDGREKIRLADLLSMSSGLQFNEDYGDVSDVTRMLFLSPDMSAFVHDRPLEHPAGTFWNYSTGTSVLLSRIWQDRAGTNALAFPHDKLFTPLGMSSAFIEADEHGTLVGGSYMYATAQDWARFGQFLLQDGVWNDHHLLPDGYVTMMHSAAPASQGRYRQGQVWLEGPYGDKPADGKTGPTFHLPADTYWLQGHDGQTVAIVPSKQLVVVRLGLTPHKFSYKPQAMLQTIVQTLE